MPSDSTSSLSAVLESALGRILDGPDAARAAAIEELCARHPDQAAQLRGSFAKMLQFGARGAQETEALVAAAEGAQAPGGAVESTATAELIEKLLRTPKLDETRYAIETEIGKGGMGAVLRIHDRHLNRRLAMKVLLERGQPSNDEERKLLHQLLGRFLEEAQVTSQLDHPGVVPVHELGLDQRGKVYFTMRLVKGRTANEVFADAHANVNDWTVTRALEVVLKVCDTMAYAHDKGVLHRDLKPSNVMVGRFGEVYVMDWGLAKVLGQQDRHDLRIRKDPGTGVSVLDTARKRDAEDDAGSSVVSMDGQQLGTPSYMAPEQARSEVLDRRADVYAIGAMMYELLTGRPPYTTPGARQPAYRILNDVLDSPPKRIEELQKGVPAELVATVERAMARRREDRYGNVLELAADVRAYIGQRVVKAYRTGALVEMKLWMRRNRALASSLAAAALILVLGIAATTTLWAKVSAENEKNRIFADVARLAEARRVEAELYPAYPDKVPAMEAWLREFGEPLAARVPDLEQELARVQARVQPTTEEERKAAREAHARWPELRRRESELVRENDTTKRAAMREQIATLQNEIAVAGFEFDDAKDSYLHRTLARLVKELSEFVAAQLRGVQARLAEARTVQQKTIDAPRARWAAAIAAIQASNGQTASTLYEHLTLTPQLGLVPIGMDQESKLWEFVHLATGTPGKEIPQRDAAGRLIPTGDMGVVFVLLPGGTLPELPVPAGVNPDPRQSVRLDPFFLSKYEMAQGQWLRLTGLIPIGSKDRNDLALPVVAMDWFDGEEVLRHQGFVLPSELRWEYGCRGGTKTLWWTGDTEETLTGKEHVGGGGLLRVGSKSPNGFGLFDMGGNVSEWCLDNFDAYGTEGKGDGLRPAGGRRPVWDLGNAEPGREGGDSSYRCMRGLGSSGAELAQSGYRTGTLPTLRYGNLGLRPARTSRL